MQELKSELEKLLVPIVLAIFGGAASYMINRQDRRKRSFYSFLSDLIIWIYVGVVSFYVLENYKDLSDSWKSVIIAFSGFSAREILLIAKEQFMKFARNKIDQDKK